MHKLEQNLTMEDGIILCETDKFSLEGIELPYYHNIDIANRYDLHNEYCWIIIENDENDYQLNLYVEGKNTADKIYRRTHRDGEIFDIDSKYITIFNSQRTYFKINYRNKYQEFDERDDISHNLVKTYYYKSDRYSAVSYYKYRDLHYISIPNNKNSDYSYTYTGDYTISDRNYETDSYVLNTAGNFSNNVETLSNRRWHIDREYFISPTTSYNILYPYDAFVIFNGNINPEVDYNAIMTGGNWFNYQKYGNKLYQAIFLHLGFTPMSYDEWHGDYPPIA